MASIEDNLSRLITPLVEGLDLEFWGLELVRPGGTRILRIYIDSPSGITMADCVRVSKQLGGVLDVEDIVAGRYELEVSSPGLDRVLFTSAHYQRFAGAMVAVRLRTMLDNRRTLQGTLGAVDDHTIEVTVDGKLYKVPLSSIERIRLVPVIAGAV